jgi:Methyl-accepting chemotaxis protein
MTLKRKFSLVVFLSAVSVAVIIGLFSYYQLKNTLLEGINQKIEAIAKGHSNTIQEWSISKANAIEALATYLGKEDVSQESLQLASDAGDFSLAYFGSSDGKMLMNDLMDSLPEGYDPRIRPWYKSAVVSGNVEFTKPYIDATTGKLIISAAKVVNKGGAVEGVVGADLYINAVTSAVLNVNLEGKGDAILVHKNGEILAHKNSDLIQKDFSTELGYSFDSLSTKSLVEVSSKGMALLASKISIPNTDWLVVYELNESKVLAPLNSLIILLIVAAVTTALIVSGVMGVVSAKLLSGITQVNAVLKQISQGQGDLTIRIPQTSNDEVGMLAKYFNDFLETLSAMVQDIKGMSSNLNDLAQNTTRLTTQSTQDLQVQLDEVTMVATAVGQMSAATHEIASNADNTATSAKAAHDQSLEGNKVVLKSSDSINNLAGQVQSAATVMGDLDEQVQGISSILLTIQDIAEKLTCLH